MCNMKLLQVLLVVICTVQFLLGQEFLCTNGTNYVENDCNRCSCSNGTLVCTKRACFGDHHERLEKCNVSTTFKRACNDCWCVKNVGTICTNNKC